MVCTLNFSCHQWVVNCGRLDFLDKTVEQISKFVLCADHFEEEWFLNPKYKTSFKRTVIPIPTIFRNNLADFVPKSLQKNCESLNLDRIGNLVEPLDFQPSDHTLIYSESELETLIYNNENNEPSDDVTVSPVDSRVFSITTVYPQTSLLSGKTLSSMDDMCQIVEYQPEESADTDKSIDEPNSELSEFMGCHRMCRLCACLVYEDALVSLFSVENERMSLATKLDRILPLKIMEDDGLPQVVCMPCVGKLKRCDDMIAAFVAADTKLRNLFLHQSSDEIELLIQTGEGSIEAADPGEPNDLNESVVKTEEFLPLITSIHDTDDETESISRSNMSAVDEVTTIELSEEIVNPPYSNEMINEETGDGMMKEENSQDLSQDVDGEVITDDLTDISSELMNNTFHFSTNGNNLHEGFGEEEHIDETKYVYMVSSYQCSTCGEEFMDKNTMLLHEIENHRIVVDEDQCNDSIICPRSTNRKREMQTCNDCGESFLGMKPLKRHIKMNHIPDENICKFCDARFKRKYSLDVHVRLHTNEKPYLCPVPGCDMCFAYKNQFKLHKFSHTVSNNIELPIKCEVCDKEFGTKINLWRHKRIHKKKVTCLCCQCGKVLSNSASLRVHMRTHNVEQACACPKCDKPFKDKVSLSKHIAIHDEAKNFPCEICGRLFYNKSLVRQHYQTHSEVKPYKCEICNTAFNRLGNLNQHIKKHMNEQSNIEPQYECLICGKRVKSELTLKYHLAKHTGEKKPFDCEICGKRFIAADPYRIHMRLHTGERPFSCVNCGKSFRSASTMKQHAALHRDEHPHACPYCERKFKRLQSLIVHKRTHTGEKNFKCPTCSRAFAQKGDMLKHTKTHMRNRLATTAGYRPIEEYVNVLRIDHMTDLALSDSDITSEYLIDMPIVEVETEIQSDIL